MDVLFHRPSMQNILIQGTVLLVEQSMLCTRMASLKPEDVLPISSILAMKYLDGRLKILI